MKKSILVLFGIECLVACILLFLDPFHLSTTYRTRSEIMVIGIGGWGLAVFEMWTLYHLMFLLEDRAKHHKTNAIYELLAILGIWNGALMLFHSLDHIYPNLYIYSIGGSLVLFHLWTIYKFLLTQPKPLNTSAYKGLIFFLAIGFLPTTIIYFLNATLNLYVYIGWHMIWAIAFALIWLFFLVLYKKYPASNSKSTQEDILDDNF